MQPPSPESYSSIERRPMDLEDYIDIVRRHKGWILGPAFAGLVLAVVVAFLWPDTYVSTAMIRVVPAQVPESLVPANVNSALSQRINSMYQTISSRQNLTNLVNTFNLYPSERNRKPLADVVEQVRKNIRISAVNPLQGGTVRREQEYPAFQISFSYNDRLVAQQVTKQLVSSFMNENARERTQSSVLTTAFLKDQTEAARRDLEALDTRLASFRENFQGRLPEQLATNQVQLNSLEQRVTNLNGSLARISQEKLLLESDLRTLKTQRASLLPAPQLAMERRKNERIASIDREILQQEGRLANFREHYTDAYPEVAKVKAQLKTLESLRQRLIAEEEAAQESTESQPNTRYDPLFEKESRQLDAAIERLETQLKAKNSEAETYQKDIAATEKRIASVQTRIQAAPASEQQYAELIRDQMLAKHKYEDLKQKLARSSIAEELERRNQGETLELLDDASLPEAPTEPKRPIILLAGLGLGLIGGMAMAGAREAKDTSLKNLKDVRAYTQLPVLGSIPLLENDLIVQRRRRLMWLAWSTACLVGILIMTAAVFYYYATKV